MTISDHQARYFAWELTKRYPIDSADRLSGALVDAQVDLNPHQVDAALFAFSSPFSRGALLADEVGLGKTIEAGLVLSQRWAERRRRLLVITPANLRKQWYQELTEKFFLPCRLLEARSYNAAIKVGQFQPFAGPEVVICSYQFARTKASDVAGIEWDLVVLDEAHRLRNVYKPNNVIANTLKGALARAPKILLTATPLQNSLLELFGLVSFIDDHTFGDLKSFREQYTSLSQDEVFATLKQRLKPVCHRTLRRQVTAFVSYTKRLPLVQEFTPEESEDRLYELVSEYLRRDNLQALPPSQRSLMTLVLRKLLASSTFAIAGALQAISQRLRKKLVAGQMDASLDALEEDYEALETTEEEWDDDEHQPPLSDDDRTALMREIEDLEEFARLAASITHDAKGKALLTALDAGFRKARQLGAAPKAIIFTESRRTQSYLLRLLADTPFRDGVVLFNGSNTDDRSKQIYVEWLESNAGTDRISGSRTADMRSALVDYFRDKGQIMIATEAGAEGINLQFCSLVVNYDLPWNPQRIEQRIGRCHRYGQKHDVVVVNFLNHKNEADQRVFQLLSEKFQLFEGVFGASDEVLGAIESGVDFERRIGEIYQTCRRPQDIRKAFDQLQLELKLEIDEAMSTTGRKLLENFDDEVREKLRVRDASSRESLGRVEQLLMRVTEHELRDHADFRSDSSFELHRSPFGADVPTGLYELPRRSGHAHTYRLNHPLAQSVVAAARDRSLPLAAVDFDYGKHGGRVSVLEPLLGAGGTLAVSVLTAAALDQAEDHLILTAATDDGVALDADIASRLLSLPGRVAERGLANVAEGPDVLAERESGTRARLLSEINERNSSFFQAETEKLERWADDLKLGLEREIKEIERKIKEARKEALASPTLEEKLAAQKQVKALEGQRNQRRRSLFDAQDEVDRQRDALITAIEGKLSVQVTMERLFTIRWRLLARPA
ncbi:MAG: SNF2-related protein [Gemmatimonadota bacterium]